MMPSIYDLKPKFQSLLKPIEVFLEKNEITPNQVTLIAVFISFIGGGLLYLAKFKPILFLIIPLILFIRMALNALDGMLAKTTNMCTKSGELLNELGDILSDSFLYLPLVFHFETSFLLQTLIWLSVLLAIINEYTGLLAKLLSGIRAYDGPMGKSDRAFFIGIYCIVLYFYPQIKEISSYIFSLLLFLLIISTFKRARKAVL
jgi:CDP-diacylglycerol--glycerol-3-phosphate 3-phosphatidyltransferase